MDLINNLTPPRRPARLTSNWPRPRTPNAKRSGISTLAKALAEPCEPLFRFPQVLSRTPRPARGRTRVSGRSPTWARNPVAVARLRMLLGSHGTSAKPRSQHRGKTEYRSRIVCPKNVFHPRLSSGKLQPFNMEDLIVIDSATHPPARTPPLAAAGRAGGFSYRASEVQGFRARHALA